MEGEAIALPLKPKKSTGAFPTLDSIKSKIASQAKKVSVQNSEPNNKEEHINKSYTDDDLLKAWNDFKELRKDMGNDQEVAFLNHDFVHTKGLIKVQIHNSILEVTFDKIRVELLAHLRKKLANDSIKIDIEKLEIESKKMLYTNKEKFEHLASMHPNVSILQEKLGLDPDY